MNILKLQELLERLVKLIEHECTGSPTELGQRLGVTDRTAKCYIAQLRDMGADIKYCTHLNSYYFASPITFRFGFEPKIDIEDTPSNGEGGGNLHRISNIAAKWFAFLKKTVLLIQISTLTGTRICLTSNSLRFTTSKTCYTTYLKIARGNVISPRRVTFGIPNCW